MDTAEHSDRPREATQTDASDALERIRRRVRLSALWRPSEPNEQLELDAGVVTDSATDAKLLPEQPLPAPRIACAYVRVRAVVDVEVQKVLNINVQQTSEANSARGWS